MTESIRTRTTEQNTPESRAARDEARVPLVKSDPPAARSISREEVRASMKRTSIQHREIIKGLAK